jgi:hypothetical protein
LTTRRAVAFKNGQVMRRVGQEQRIAAIRELEEIDLHLLFRFGPQVLSPSESPKTVHQVGA